MHCAFPIYDFISPPKIRTHKEVQRGKGYNYSTRQQHTQHSIHCASTYSNSTRQQHTATTHAAHPHTHYTATCNNRIFPAAPASKVKALTASACNITATTVSLQQHLNHQQLRLHNLLQPSQLKHSSG